MYIKVGWMVSLIQKVGGGRGGAGAKLGEGVYIYCVSVLPTMNPVVKCGTYFNKPCIRKCRFKINWRFWTSSISLGKINSRIGNASNLAKQLKCFKFSLVLPYLLNFVYKLLPDNTCFLNISRFFFLSWTILGLASICPWMSASFKDQLITV